MNGPSHPRVAVVGPGEPPADVRALAEQLGRLLAEAGCDLYCGGLGGVMEAACRGAFEAGGLTVGVLPGADAAEGNPYLRVVVATGMGEARNLVIVRSAQAVIAVGKGYGTLSEIAFALRLGKPVVLLHSWEEVAADARVVASPEEAVRVALGAIVP